jgi:hypothetical protein
MEREADEALRSGALSFETAGEAIAYLHRSRNSANG